MEKPLDTGRRVLDLKGTYALYPASNPDGAIVTLMNIYSQRGKHFLVRCAVSTGMADPKWEGRGFIEGKVGEYDWTFLDGKKGRTTITVDRNGHLFGGVRGAGIDWDYVAKRLERPVREPKK